MDFDFYVAVRRRRLVEFAMQLGCPEELAGQEVDRVLDEQRHRVQKADDPDPIVHEALAKAVRGQPVNRHRRRLAACASLIAVGLAVVALKDESPAAKPVPSLVGYDQRAAESLLQRQGYAVEVRSAPVCRLPRQVLGTWPPPGEPVEEGGRVTLITAKPPGSFCVAYYLHQQDASEFVRFAIGGPTPRFSDTVEVIVDNGEPEQLTGGSADLLAAWGDALDVVAEAARASVETDTGMPQLTVRSWTPPPVTCGVSRPVVTGHRSALRMQIDPYPFGYEKCPLTVDLYRVDRVIDMVVVYTAQT